MPLPEFTLLKPDYEFMAPFNQLDAYYWPEDFSIQFVEDDNPRAIRYDSLALATYVSCYFRASSARELVYLLSETFDAHFSDATAYQHVCNTLTHSVSARYLAHRYALKFLHIVSQDQYPQFHSFQLLLLAETTTHIPLIMVRDYQYPQHDAIAKALRFQYLSTRKTEGFT